MGGSKAFGDQVNFSDVYNGGFRHPHKTERQDLFQFVQTVLDAVGVILRVRIDPIAFRFKKQNVIRRDEVFLIFFPESQFGRGVGLVFGKGYWPTGHFRAATGQKSMHGFARSYEKREGQGEIREKSPENAVCSV